MSIQTWLGQIVRLFQLRRGSVVLWRLQDWRGAAEASCLCQESVPGEFHVVVAYAGVPEVERTIAGIDALLHWSDRLRGTLEAGGWRAVDDLSRRRSASRRDALNTADPVYARMARERTDR